MTFPKWEDLLSAPARSIEGAISTAGMGKRRAQLLRRLTKTIVRRFGSLDISQAGSLPPEMAEEELIRLPGVGRKVARCVLLYCFRHPVLPVDVHTYRLAVRLGILTRNVSYSRAHTLLPQLIPPKLRKAFHVNAVAHGRRRCFAQHPDCIRCPLASACSEPKATKSLPVNLRPRPLALDLFVGAGGLTLGFRKVGFQVVQAIDKDPNVARTYQHNNPDVDFVLGDIRLIDPKESISRLALRPGDLTVLLAGPPCQGFSESNRRTRTDRNPKNHLYADFIRFLGVLRPTWFVFENVAGLRTLANGTFLRRIVNKCRAVGYSVEWTELNAGDYGIPQLRRRIFVIGNRNASPILFPEPTHGVGRKPYVTVREAIGDLPALPNGCSIDYMRYCPTRDGLTPYQRMMRLITNGAKNFQGNLVTRNSQNVIIRYQHIRQGENWESIPTELMANYQDCTRCHTGIYHRLAWEKPAKVIGNFRKNMLIHPEEDRGLSVREAARLQSFPDSYVFLGSIGFQQQQVADAVPPLLAQEVAARILAIERRTGSRR
jgi:DNA (cytosine-5)-methyltransferase 1